VPFLTGLGNIVQLNLLDSGIPYEVNKPIFATFWHVPLRGAITIRYFAHIAIQFLSLPHVEWRSILLSGAKSFVPSFIDIFLCFFIGQM